MQKTKPQLRLVKGIRVKPRSRIKLKKTAYILLALIAGAMLLTVVGCGGPLKHFRSEVTQ